jgi:membrane protein
VEREGLRARVVGDLRRLPARAWLIIRHAVDSLIKTAGTRDAAQVAFYVLLSFPPILLLVVWGFSAALDDERVRQEIVSTLVDALPLSDEEGREEIEELLDGVARGAGSQGWIGAIALLYSASGAIAALRHAVNQAWGIAEGLPYFQGKALDVGVVLIVAPLAVVAMTLNLANTVPNALDDAPLFAGLAALMLSDLIPLALAFGLLTGLYRVLPAERASFRAALAGALVGTLGIVVVNFGAEAYVAAFGNAGTVYGTLGALLAAIFAIYIQAVVVIVGAHVAAQLARLPDGAAIDAEIEAESGGESTPIGRFLLNALRGLFLRPRRRRREGRSS